MTRPAIVAISGSPSPRSRTRVVLEDVAQAIAERVGATVTVVDVGELASLLGPVRDRAQAPAEIERLIAATETCDLILAASPVHKGSYTGLFKHFVDMIDYRALAGRPVGLIATGGSDRHSLVIDHQFRPLFGFFNAATLATGVYLAENQHRDGHVVDPLARARLDTLAAEAAAALSRSPVPA